MEMVEVCNTSQPITPQVYVRNVINNIHFLISFCKGCALSYNIAQKFETYNFSSLDAWIVRERNNSPSIKVTDMKDLLISNIYQIIVQCRKGE